MEQMLRVVKRSPASPCMIGMAVLGLSVSACTVGPGVVELPVPDNMQYARPPLLTETVAAPGSKGGAQTISSQDVPVRWWEHFGSPPLNQLIESALDANPDIAASEAAIKAAQANLAAVRGGFWPSLQANAGTTRRKFAGASFGQPDVPDTILTLHNASVDVSYNIDVFGKTRNSVRSVEAQLNAERHQAAATRLTLVANIVTYAVQEASLRAQIDETKAIIEIEAERLSGLDSDHAAGAIAFSAVVAQKTNLAELRATLPPLRKRLALTRNQLATLAGRMPAESIAATFTLETLALPSEIPVGVPSELVRRRPDLRLAEARVDAAAAEVGVATANLLPQLNITGSLATLSPDAPDLFRSDSVIWDIAAGIAQPLFNGGTLRHRRRAALARLEQASSMYRSTVLMAFQGVADSLQALAFDAEALAAQTQAEASASAHLSLAEEQLRLGAISSLALLDAQRRYHEARIGVIQARAARIATTAALFHAIAGPLDIEAHKEDPHQAEAATTSSFTNSR